MLLHQVVLRRNATNLGAQDMYVSFSAKGAALFGVSSGGTAPAAPGFASEANGVAVYAKIDADIAVGDLFAYDGSQYRIEHVTPRGRQLTGEDLYRVAWAVATGGPGW